MVGANPQVAALYVCIAWFVLICHVVPDGAAAAAGLREGFLGQKLSAAWAAHAGLGPASLVLYDVSTLYFEAGTGDGLREPGFRRSGGWSRRSPSAC
jgi:hypothetical protein